MIFKKRKKDVSEDLAVVLLQNIVALALILKVDPELFAKTTQDIPALEEYMKKLSVSKMESILDGLRNL